MFNSVYFPVQYIYAQSTFIISRMNELFNKPLNQLTEEEKNQLSEKQKKALKALIGSKPSVAFSKATLNDCIRPDGLALNIDYVSVKAPTIHIPVDFPEPTATAHLCESLARIEKVWVLDNEKACRIVIDAILTDVLLNESNEQLLGFCEVQNDWEGPGFVYTGNVDYMLGSSKTKSVDTMDSFLLVVEAKKEWPDDAVAQVLCEAGCLLKKRLAAGKETPVFAVLTNGLLFRFFAIDTNGVVYSSEVELLKIGRDGTYNSSTSLSEILRWFTWFIASIKSVSPRASSEDLTAEKIGDSLTQLRSCFGPKKPTSSKKIKIQK
ncbi:hypothetical protein BC833DRAFT_569266 [Globomyces pollinis-pini]|nr:hypothetical protein BC833DRAFT_569266 [Globomyces pollinis-pini]